MHKIFGVLTATLMVQSRAMWPVIKRLALALTLLFLCSALLLFSDLKSRRGPRRAAVPQQKSELSKRWKIHFISFVDSPFVEEAQEGTKAGFIEAGLVEGRDFESTLRNAQGDISNLNNIVDAALNEKTDLIYTYTTPALQVVSKKTSTTPTIFTLAVDPLSWGLAKSHAVHPANLTGVYVSIPADPMIRILRQCIPNIRKIGTVFTPSESNSTYVVDQLRKAAEQNGIQLLLAPAASSTEVSTAASSLCQQNIDAICQIPDNNTGAAFASIAQAVARAHIPLFCFGTPQAKLGGAVAISADYFDAGRQGALLAARIMRGENPAGIPMEPVTKNKLVVNPEAARRAGLVLPESVLKEADEIIDKDGSIKTQRSVAPPKWSKKWNIHLLEYTNILDVEESEHGIRDGFRNAGLVEGRHYRLTVRNAQGDMISLSSMIDAAVTDQAELFLTMSTPTLQGALQRARGTPIVFTLVASAVAAGAGESNEDHLPNVTGVLTTSAYDELIAVIRKCLPSAKRLGTLFVPSETNSIYNRDKTEEAARKAGLELISVSATGSSEVSNAALSLLARDVDAICQIAGNLTASAFTSIAEPARVAKVPVFAFQTNQAEQGAAVVVARDYYDGGKQAAEIAVRVMNGEKPAKIPFQQLKTTRLLINLKAARNCSLSIPPEILKMAARVIE